MFNYDYAYNTARLAMSAQLHLRLMRIMLGLSSLPVLALTSAMHSLSYSASLALMFLHFSHSLHISSYWENISTCLVASLSDTFFLERLSTCLDSSSISLCNSATIFSCSSVGGVVGCSSFWFLCFIWLFCVYITRLALRTSSISVAMLCFLRGILRLARANSSCSRQNCW